MARPHIQIKQKLARSEPVVVLSGHHTTDMIDFLGPLGPDGIWIETEHGPVSWEQIGDMARACDLWDMASITRVPANEPWIITRTLDRGTSGITVPHVSTKAAAEQVVQSAKFGPIGQRGMYGSRRSYGVDAPFQHANEETFIVVLIEEQEAVQNLAEILTVDHIDVFFVAPSDLAQTMGHTGNNEHPEVQATIDHALKQIIDAGKTAGTLVTDQNVEHYLDLGVRFIYTAWTSWAARGLRQFQATVATRVASQGH